MESASYSRRVDELGTVLDRVTEADRELAIVAARRAELIEAARRLSIAHAAATAAEATAAGGASRPPMAWDPAVVAHRELVSELACALRIPERTAGKLMEASRALMNDLPATRAALAVGAISYRHAEVMVDHASSLPIDAVSGFETDVLLSAQAHTVAKFDTVARVQRERRHPESVTTRAARSRGDRSVTCDPARDGMAWLTAFLPADIAFAAHQRLTDIAVALDGPDESRTLSQLRADALSDLLIDGTTDPEPEPVEWSSPLIDASAFAPEEFALLSYEIDGEPLTQAEEGVLREIQAEVHAHTGDLIELEALAGQVTTFHRRVVPTPSIAVRSIRESIGRGIRARILVTVPVMTLLGHEDTPATLDGYGPIDPETARELAASAPSFTRLLTHPETGAVLSVGRDRYSVPRDLRTYLQVRDETCRFPGCNARTVRCDVDHTLDWATDGKTEHDNLAHLCPRHHRLKHHTHWRVDQPRGGILEWTSPTRHRYLTYPGTTLPAARTVAFGP